MPHVTPPDIQLLADAEASMRRATSLTDAPWEQRDVERALELMATLAEHLQIMTSRARTHLPEQGQDVYSRTLHGTVEHLGMAMLDLGHVAEMLHMQWTDSIYSSTPEALNAAESGAPLAYEPNKED